MIQFFSPDITETLQLPEIESGHCVRVLRKSEGDEIAVTDGKGFRYKCRIIEANPKCVNVSIISKEYVNAHWPAKLSLGIAPTKNMDRMEWLCEKITELGIDEIIPLLCEHSERRELKNIRLNKILVSAMKQSLKTKLPELYEMTKITDFLDRHIQGQKFIAYCGSGYDSKILSETYVPGIPATILIGPEGDFSPKEVKQAIDSGFIPVSLGDSRMRTETAALFSIASFHALNMAEKHNDQTQQAK